MARLQRVAARHRRLVIALWLAALAAAIPFALRQSDHLSGAGFDIAGSQAARVEAALLRGIPPDFRPAPLGILLRGAPHAPADARRAIAALQRSLRGDRTIALPAALAQGALFEARAHPATPVVVPLLVRASEFSAPDLARALQQRLDRTSRDGRYGAARLQLVGAGAAWSALLHVSESDLRGAEHAGFPLVLLILLVVFGSLTAALLPLAVGALTVTLTGAVLYGLSTVTVMSVFATNMAAMVGLGVAVDYSLFVVVRYRDELRLDGDPDRARRRAMATSGRAVLFSGGVVIAALAGMFAVPSPAVRSLALAAIVVVGLSVLACAGLLPALLAVAGRRIGPGAPRRPRWLARLAATVTTRPAASLAAGLALVVALAVPAAWIHVGDAALRELPADNATRQAIETAARVAGPGAGAPIKILVAPGHQQAALNEILADPEVARAGARTLTADRRQVLIVATPRHGPDDPQTKHLVRRLRRALPAGSLVGGNSAAQVDFDHAVTRSLWKVALWASLLTILVLLAMIRAPLIAALAIAANALSLLAAFGVLTLLFVGRGPGFIDTIALPLVLAAVFGLSMDYQVFLLSRIRELHDRGHGTRDAVRLALEGTGRTITGAAAIMIAVFSVFALTGVPAVQEVGAGAAAAIAIDATLIRLIVVPAALVLLGERCWTLPRTGQNGRPAARGAQRTGAPPGHPPPRFPAPGPASELDEPGHARPTAH